MTDKPHPDTAEAFCDVLREKDVVPASVLAALRKQLAQAKAPVPAAKIAKILIDKGFLTPLLAKRLLGGKEADGDPATKRPQPKSDAAKKPAAETPAAASGFASLLDEELPPLPGGAGGFAGGGSLDALLSDPSFQAAAASGSPLLPAAPRKSQDSFFARFNQRGKSGTYWDAPVAWIGGGVAALLLLGGALLWTLTRPSSEELLAPADADYQAGQYAAAVAKYDEYLRQFPKQAAAGRARVRRGLAQVRLAVEGKAEGTLPLGTVRDVLTEIAAEAEFRAEGGEMLASLFADAAERLAEQARKPPDAALAKQAQETLALIDDFVPRRDWPLERLGRIELSAALTLRDTAAGRKPAAAAIDKSAVKWVAEERPALGEELPAETVATVALAQRETKSNAPDTAGHTVFAEALGAVYALDAASGKVLWRRYVGFGGDGQSVAPTPVSAEPGADVLLLDHRRNELQRVAAATGQPRWRHPLGERTCVQPVVAGGRALLATHDGRLLHVDLKSGDSSGYVQLPLPERVPPAVDAGRGLVFQVADRASLFVLGQADGRCRQALHLGHEAGSVTAPPTIAGGFLLLAVNDTLRGSTLRALAIDAVKEDSRQPLLRPVQELRLDGHVDLPPLADGQTVLVTTDAGAVYVFELGPPGSKTPLREAVRASVAGGDGLLRFTLLREGKCWIAGAELAGYEVRLGDGRLLQEWNSPQRGTCLQPLRAVGKTIFQVCRREAMPGVVASAVAADQPELHWQTWLAAPLAGEPVVDAAGGQIAAVTAAGAVFRLNAVGLKKQSVVDQPFAVAAGAQQCGPVANVVRLNDALLAMTGDPGSDYLAVVDFGARGGSTTVAPTLLHEWRLPGRLNASPAALGSRLLTPVEIGQVLLLSPKAGDLQSAPFQPRVERGATPAWRTPTPLGDAEAVAADDRGRLVRLSIAAEPQPHLMATAEGDLPQPIVSPLAALGETLFGVDAAGSLVVLSAADLKAVQQRHKLPGRCTWGPQRVGEYVLLTTESGHLLCFEAAGKLLWQSPLRYGPLAGTPLAAGEDYVLAAAGGIVWRIAAQSGKEAGKLDTGLPLATGPVSLGQQLLVGGCDGSLHMIEQP